jgi:hypothetical protein
MSNRDPHVVLQLGLERRPNAEEFLGSFNRCARWLHATYGGPRMTLSASARRVIGSCRKPNCDWKVLAHVVAAEGPRFAVANLLWRIASHGHRLRETGRTALDLPAEARDALLAFIWSRPIDLQIVKRAVEAAQELDRHLGWKILAKIGDQWVAVPGAFDD